MVQAAHLSNNLRNDTPAPPLLLSRTPHSVTLTHRPFKLKSYKKPAYFAVYAKNFGAGVGLGMNSTSMELEGTGQQQPLEARVTISGNSSLLCLDLLFCFVWLRETCQQQASAEWLLNP